MKTNLPGKLRHGKKTQYAMDNPRSERIKRLREKAIDAFEAWNDTQNAIYARMAHLNK